MSIEEIETICKKLKGITTDIKWENHLCFNIGGKMFLVTAPDNFPVSASLKVSDDDFENLPSREGIIPAPYMARHKWVFLDDINRFSKKEWEHYIAQAYQIVAGKLPLRTQMQIGLIVVPSPVKKQTKQGKKQIKTASKKVSKRTPAKRKR